MGARRNGPVDLLLGLWAGVPAALAETLPTATPGSSWGLSGWAVLALGLSGFALVAWDRRRTRRSLEQVEDLLARAQEQEDAGEPEAAMESLAKARALHERDDRAERLPIIDREQGRLALEGDRFDEAETHLRRALPGLEAAPGPQGRDLGWALQLLGRCLFASGRKAEALEPLRRSLAAVDGPDPAPLSWRVNVVRDLLAASEQVRDDAAADTWADRLERMLDEGEVEPVTLARAHYDLGSRLAPHRDPERGRGHLLACLHGPGADSDLRRAARSALVEACRDQGRLAEAERHARELLDEDGVVDAGDPRALTYSRTTLAGILARTGRSDEAQVLLEAAEAAWLTGESPGRGEAIQLRLQLAQLQLEAQRPAEAAASLETARERTEALPPGEAKDELTRRILGLRAREAWARGALADAEGHARRALADALAGRAGADELAARHELLGSILAARESRPAALAELASAAHQLARFLAPDHPDLGWLALKRADLLIEQGSLEEAQARAEEAERILVPALGEWAPEIVELRILQARVLAARGLHADAVAGLAAVASGLAHALGAGHPAVGRVWEAAGATWWNAEEPAKAEDALSRALVAYDTPGAGEPGRRAAVRRLLAEIASADGRWDEAAALREAAAVLEKDPAAVPARRPGPRPGTPSPAGRRIIH